MYIAIPHIPVQYSGIFYGSLVAIGGHRVQHLGGVAAVFAAPGGGVSLKHLGGWGWHKAREKFSRRLAASGGEEKNTLFRMFLLKK